MGVEDLEVWETADGSSTLFDPTVGESFHSARGALAESRYVFAQCGLERHRALDTVQVLEIGMGTGLNLLATLEYVHSTGQHVHYTGIELRPLSMNVLRQLQVPSVKNSIREAWLQAMAAPWGSTIAQELASAQGKSTHIIVQKVPMDVHDYTFPHAMYHTVYLDAFSPSVAPTLWEEELLSHVVRALQPAGVMVTYTASGTVKRTLRALGMQIERLPGAGGKRHMLRAVKSSGKTVVL